MVEPSRDEARLPAHGLQEAPLLHGRAHGLQDRRLGAWKGVQGDFEPCGSVASLLLARALCTEVRAQVYYTKSEGRVQVAPDPGYSAWLEERIERCYEAIRKSQIGAGDEEE